MSIYAHLLCSVLDEHLKFNVVNLDNVDYNHDYGICMLTCVHHHNHNQSIYVCSVIHSGLCFTQSLIVLNLEKDDPLATVYDYLKKTKGRDKEFHDSIKLQNLNLIYNYQQDKPVELVSYLRFLLEEYHILSFHEFLHKTIPISALNREAGLRLSLAKSKGTIA